MVINNLHLCCKGYANLTQSTINPYPVCDFSIKDYAVIILGLAIMTNGKIKICHK
jgi:hypothetical protein